MTDTDAAPVRLAPGDPAPDFTLPDADGNPVSLADLPRPARHRLLLPGGA